MAQTPPSQVCPLCGDDEAISALPSGADGGWAFTCTGGAGHSTPYSWEITTHHQLDGRDGIMAELGVYEDLLECVHAGEPWVEHGVVEH